jgi:hypothetical protein
MLNKPHLSMFNVIYYNYYIFYKRVLNDNGPHLLATLALSASQFFPIWGLIDLLLTHFWCYMGPLKWIFLSIILPILLVNYFVLHSSGKAKIIIEEKPQYFGSEKISALLSVLYFAVTSSFLFWVPVYTRDYLVHHCGLILNM